MEVLGLTAAQIAAGGARFTAHEIAQQPSLWPEITNLIARDQALASFLAPLLQNPELRIVLTGAGTSSFIGECLAPALARAGNGRRVHAIPTTDIVASPASWLTAKTPTLMVHFSRSGNSPESVAAMELAEKHVERCSHLTVTCTAEGALYRRTRGMRHAHALLLEACNDQSFAMTASFTGMLLAAGLALKGLAMDASRSEHVAQLGSYALTSCLPVITSLVRAQFERVVYLGSGELKGLAHEAALKMLELTDGRVVATANSPLAFRHGPKAIVNGSTLVVVFLSNDPHTRRYDDDLVAELRRDGIAGRVIALANHKSQEHADTLLFQDAGSGEHLPDLALCLPYVAFSQALAMLRSLSLGLTPDNPNVAGTVNRVVQGVSIYPYGS
jgi:tagatose-6-phosphate ketose/aldose isomerase